MRVETMYNTIMPLPPDLSKPIFSMMPELADRIINGVCTYCVEPLTLFNDELSKQEYGITGMCQACQDKIYEKEDSIGFIS